jgi:short-subunit dehydrogenase
VFDLKVTFMAQAATKTAIVTGAAGGVARALLPMLIGDGYRVALIDVNAIGLGKIAAEHGDKVVALPCDLTDLPALTAALEKARVTFGTLDLLINNAGVATTGPFVDIDPASIPRDIGINLVAPLHIIHTVAPWMRSPGAIVNTISMASITPLAGSSVYSATKFALRGFNIALHMLMKPCGITVSGVLPGAIDTPMLLKATREGATALNFLGDPLPPEKVAKVILRAAKEGKVEYYIPYSERILSSFALLFPALIPTIYPWFEKWALSARRPILQAAPKIRCRKARRSQSESGRRPCRDGLLTRPAGSASAPDMGAVRMLAYQILQHLRRRNREAVERLRPVHESMSPHAAAVL